MNGTPRPLSLEDGEELAQIFRILGDAGRLRIILACRKEPRSVNSLAEEMGMSPPLVSHHLRLLRAARLVKPHRLGKYVYYSLADHHVGHMLSDMVDHITECKTECNVRTVVRRPHKKGARP